MSSLSTSRSSGTARELPTELPPRAGRAAAGIAIVLVAQLMIVLDATVVNVALPRIDADLAFGPAALSWVLNAYTLAFGGLLLLGGRLGLDGGHPGCLSLLAGNVVGDGGELSSLAGGTLLGLCGLALLTGGQPSFLGRWVDCRLVAELFKQPLLGLGDLVDPVLESIILIGLHR